MKASERVFNVLAGVSVLSWVVLGIRSEWPDLGGVRVCVSIINLVVGILFLTRKPIVLSGKLREMLACVPSFILGGMAFKLGNAHHPWPLYALVLFVSGTALVLAGLFALGRSFAVLPALRGLAKNGPYRLVRHPIYLGELLLVLACALAHPSLWMLLLPAALFPCLALRIAAEERVLGNNREHSRYCREVRWRLCPWVW